MPCKAQSQRIYVNEISEVTTNRQLASSYVDITKLAQDSVWLARQFNLKDTLLSTGSYKDAALKIPHGKFIYYGKMAHGTGVTFMGKLYFDSLNYIHYSGYYFNGVKTGTWIEYLPGGLRSCLRTYKNNLLDGLFQTYNDSGKVAVEGHYVNNKQEGDWFEFNEDGTVLGTLVFKHGKLVKHFEGRKPN